jgi:hypothetical protein
MTTDTTDGADGADFNRTRILRIRRIYADFLKNAPVRHRTRTGYALKMGPLITLITLITQIFSSRGLVQMGSSVKS